MVLAGRQERVFCGLPVHLLRPAEARRGAGDRVEAQPHGLLHALLHPGHEGIPQQGEPSSRGSSGSDGAHSLG